MRRLGLLGGTLDPIHNGHLDAADAARAALALDEIVVVPAHDPPHRPTDPRASSYHRFAMVALAIDGRRGYRASDLELRREGPSYTALTLRDLHAAGWPSSQIYFIIGADAFADVSTWYDYPAVLDACHFAVVARRGLRAEAALARVPDLRARAGRSVHLIEAATADVSSTEVRRRLSAGDSIEGLVPAAVSRHIAAHQLYRTVDELHGQD